MLMDEETGVGLVAMVGPDAPGDDSLTAGMLESFKEFYLKQPEAELIDEGKASFSGKEASFFETACIGTKGNKVASRVLIDRDGKSARIYIFNFPADAARDEKTQLPPSLANIRIKR
ncbi:hypothetical protein K2D_44750 [Planctomycetes bacterium K2D]|uniref:Uncharacterized protein n=2 Tax=Botrimarina mediterranea TaxID=2528022 RepID=A0A518KEM8_9BACT|nr:hypothetical protein Spa11_44720 [Botrimarina mediterranea]QDV80845.1 hypothetical protein K2D_44750 [Planctomycetes bacterium K2D]